MSVSNQNIEKSVKDQMNFGIHMNDKKGVYCTINDTGNVTELSNFKVEVLCRMDIPKYGYRIMKLTNTKGEMVEIRVRSKTLLRPKKFIKKIAGAGDFLWLGDDYLKFRLVNYIISSNG